MELCPPVTEFPVTAWKVQIKDTAPLGMRF